MWGSLWAHLQEPAVLLRSATPRLAALVLLILTRGWAPPLSFRVGDYPPRDIVVRTQFEKLDEEATRAKAGKSPVGRCHL